MSEPTKQMFNHRSGLSAKVFASSVSQPLGEDKISPQTAGFYDDVPEITQSLQASSHLSSQQKPIVTQRRESSLVDLKHMKHVVLILQKAIAIALKHVLILQKYKAGPGLWFNCEQE